MILIGDVHGSFQTYKKLIEGCDSSIQLGDMGIGFHESHILDLSDISGDHKFIRGNHDNPRVCREHPNYIGDYGILKGDWCGDHHYETLFYMSGAWSIDKQFRTPAVDWWFDEELSYVELDNAVEVYLENLPDIVVTHDCPFTILPWVATFTGPSVRSKTGTALDYMWSKHHPRMWVFAHHHKHWEKELDTTKFVCLNILETFSI